LPTPFAIISFWETYRGAAHSGKRWNARRLGESEGRSSRGKERARERARERERERERGMRLREGNDRGGRAVRGNVNWGDLLRN